jgi:hypothetical protein
MVAEWGGVSISTVPLEIEAPPGHETGVISGDAGLANLGSHGVNRARRGGADVADKGRTAIARASHVNADRKMTLIGITGTPPGH